MARDEELPPKGDSSIKITIKAKMVDRGLV